MHVREMNMDDLMTVVSIERENFSNPWSDTGILTHMLRDDTLYLVAVDEDSPKWLAEKAHEGENPEAASAYAADDALTDEEYFEKYGVEYQEEIRDGEVVGYIGMIMVPDEADITKVAVRKERQHGGIGSSLVKELIELSPEHGVYNIFLEVRVSNAPAIGLYEKYGFETVGMRKKYYTGPVEDALVMKKHIE